MSKKLFYIFVFLIFVLFLSGCTTNEIVPGPNSQTAELHIYFEPNPVPYNAIDEEWNCTITIEESNGIPVNLKSITFLGYNWLDELSLTLVLGTSDIQWWFGTSFLFSYSTIQADIPTSTERQYDMVTVVGIDSNGHQVETTGRINYLPIEY
jgi:ABC-type Fe3+-hydroxamate transport system substrate-binding protein